MKNKENLILTSKMEFHHEEMLKDKLSAGFLSVQLATIISEMVYAHYKERHVLYLRKIFIEYEDQVLKFIRIKVRDFNKKKKIIDKEF